MFANGIPKLRKVKKKKKKDRTPRPPKAITDAVFAQYPKDQKEAESGPITDLKQAFDQWGCEVVLVDFFAFSCTNCIRTLPNLKQFYSTFGPRLQVLAFARPEFVFEGEIPNVKEWIKRNGVEYAVATDCKGSNWKAFGVTGWPTQYLIVKDGRSKFQGKLMTAETYIGDRNPHIIFNRIKKLLKIPDEKVPEMAPHSTEYFSDMEVFFGKDHRYKNVGADHCAETKACAVVDTSTADAIEMGLPLPNKDSGSVTVYGAAWCRFCRRTKVLLNLSNVTFDYVDVDSYGGPDATQRALTANADKPAEHTTLPVVFYDGKFLGGFTDTLAKYPDIDEAKIEAAVNASTIEYKKEAGDVTITHEAKGWSLDGEALTAKTDGAVLSVTGHLNETTTGVSVFVVAEGVEGKAGWLKYGPADNETTIEVPYAGRHFLKSFDAADFTTKLRASLGLRVYVLWFSSEPAE